MDYTQNGAIEPGTGELLQEDGPLPIVEVHHAAPVRTHELPARIAVSRNISVTDSTAAIEQPANDDLRRKYFKITVTGFPCYVGHDKQSVMDGTAGILPVGLVLDLPTSAVVYVRAAAVGTAVVSYWTGNWAD